MDKSAKEIVFTKTGCNFCDQAVKTLRENELEKHKLLDILDLIKKQRGEYDCIIGLSGGVDSSRVLHEAIKFGLKPLAFSVDNGWQDAKADENIMRMVEKLRVPFYRYVLDINKFRDLQAAFIKAGVPNIEIPTDHVLMAVSLELANKYGVKWILSGGNGSTESIMPESWGYNARDLTHIEDIYTKMTGKRLTGLPVCGLFKWNYYRWFKRIKTFYLLDYMEYNRAESIVLLEKEYGYKSYGAKHEESVFTKWFQNYYLYEKFSIDKRKAHLSSLICSGQMTRKEALMELGERPVYPRIGLETKVMQYPKRSHEDYKKDPWFDRISLVIRTTRKWLY